MALETAKEGQTKEEELVGSLLMRLAFLVDQEDIGFLKRVEKEARSRSVPNSTENIEDTLWFI